MKGNDLDNVRQYELQCVSQTLLLFDVMSGSDDTPTLSHLSRCIGISKNKMFRLLVTLEQHGIVEKTEAGGYRFAGGAFALARRIMLRRSVMNTARPIMARLAAAINEAVYLATDENGSMLLRDMIDCRQAIKSASFVGAAFPAPSAASGMSAFPGVCISIGGLDAEITTVSAKYKTAGKAENGALVVLAPSYRMTNERIGEIVAPELLDAAGRLSDALSAAGRKGFSGFGQNGLEVFNHSLEELGSSSSFNYHLGRFNSQQQL